jgi:hypothetical protein
VCLTVRLVSTMCAMGTSHTSRSVRASQATSRTVCAVCTSHTSRSVRASQAIGRTVCAVGTSSRVCAVRSVRSVCRVSNSTGVAMCRRRVSAETTMGSGRVGSGGVRSRRTSHAVAGVVVAISGHRAGNVLLQNRGGNLSRIRGILVVTVCAKRKKKSEKSS